MIRRAWVIPVAALAVLSAAPAPLAAQRACDAAVAPSASGEWSAPLDVRVTLHVADVSLRDALDRLTAISKVPLAYSAETLPVDKRVCVSADREPLGALLATLLRGAAVKVIVVSGRVVLTPDAVRANNDAVSHSVSVLERVVVTGSAVAAPRRPLAVGMDVIDGAQLRRQELSSLSDILDAAVPGLWSWSQSPSTLVAQYGGVRGASSFGSSSPKIYIDGVEVANPLVVTQINPDVIDRIEVIRGPQGAALYGSDAISGVINVLTRHDGGAVAAPSILFHSTAGAAGSDYVAGLVPTHEQRLTVRAGSNVRSAGFAATFGQTGSLVPSSESRQIAAVADARLVTARETLNIAARLYDKRSGVGRNPLLAAYIPAAQAPPTGAGSGPTPSVPASTDESQSVRQYTLSTSAAFATEGPWSHTLLAGLDGYSLNNVADAIGPIPTALDSALRAARGSGDRYTLRESSVARFGDGEDALGTITLGVEHSVLRQATTAVTTRKMMPGQQYPTAVDGIVETWNHNTGLLSQVNMTWQQSIFLTGGLRIERNDSFTGTNRYPVLPMVGLAVVRSLGDAEVKWRAAYGKGIRPPQTPARSAASGYAGGLGWMSGGVGGVLPALDPEVQTGYEAGVELYLGKALQFQLTRFDQRVTGLIQSVAVAVETFAARGGGNAERRVRYQLQNVGEITNTGWEAQGSFSNGPFMLSSALSSVDSRVRALATGYQGDLQPNDRMLAVPARTGSLTLSWAGDRWTAALGATRAMDWINYDRLTLARDYAAAASTQGGQSTHDFTGARLRSYWRTYDGETHLRLTATRDLSRGIALLVAGENLLGGQLGEPDNVTIRPGRTATAGLRASF